MVNLLMLIAITAAVTIIGGGFGYLIWLKTRPKKEIWNAKIYQLGEGIREPIVHRGKVVSKLKLQDLRPYAKDILEKLEKKHGVVIYRLKKLNKTVPAVEGGAVEYWGANDKEVSVLFTKSGCTLMKKGFDKVTGDEIFDPLPHSRINLMKEEMLIRKERYEKEKDVLQAITPWVIAGICIIGLVAIAYIMISGFSEISEKMGDTLKEQKVLEQQNWELEKKIQEMKLGIPVAQQPTGAQNTTS